MSNIRQELETRARMERTFRGVHGVADMFRREGYEVAVTVVNEQTASMTLTRDGTNYEIDCSYHPPPKTALQQGGGVLAKATIRRD